MSIQQKHCDRCGEELGKISRMSWFTTEIICTVCKDKETKIRELLPNKGIYFEGIGFVPINYTVRFKPDMPIDFIELDIEV
jgi:predicted nucleic acid-binding Zn ribbon protein